MPTGRQVQTNFTAGEVSPLLFGRVDIQKYANGAAQLQNFIVRQQGPLWKRPGTKFVGAVKKPSKKTIVQHWSFSDTQEYVLEIGEFYIRIWLNGGFIETFVGSGIPLELVTPYAEADLVNLRFTQSADVLFIASGKYPILQLQRLSANSWTLAPFLPNDGPYLPDSTVVDTSLVMSNVSSQSNAIASANVFFATTSFAIAAVGPGTNSVLYGIPQLIINVPGHTYSVGNVVTVTDLRISYVKNNLTYVNDVKAGFPMGNGTYTITTVFGNNLTLQNSVYAANVAGYTYDVSHAHVTLNSTLNNYVEYKENNSWRLGRVIYALNGVSGVISPVLVYKDFIPGVNISYDSANLNVTADHAGTFTVADVNKWYRLNNGQWIQLTGFISDTQMKTANGPLNVRYVYPNIYVNSQNQTTMAIASASRPIFTATDVGRPIRMYVNGNQPWGQIVFVLNTFQAVVWLVDNTVDIDPTTGILGGATNLIRMGAWSDTTTWPKFLTFHEQRLVAVNSDTQPQNLWMSQSGDFPNFGPTLYDSTVTDACSINYTLASPRANPIYWVLSGPTMLMGTLGGEYQVKAATLGAPLSPTNIQVLPQTDHGSLATAMPYRIGYATLFIQRAGRKLFELTYEFTLDSYVSNNLTITSEHIFRQGVQAFRVSYQKEPNAVVWVVLQNGTLAAMTYERAQAITAWHRHVLGGTLPNLIPFASSYNVLGANQPYFYVPTGLSPNVQYKFYTGANEPAGVLLIFKGGSFTNVVTVRTGQTFMFAHGDTLQMIQGTNSGSIGPFPPITVTARIVTLDPTGTTGVNIESITSVSSQAGTENIVYMVVQRTINGVTQRYIESMQPDFFPTTPTDRSAMWYLDCAQQYNGAPATVISGLGYLEQEFVTVVADGSLLTGPFQVNGGQITLPSAHSQVTVGYPYRTLLQTLPPDFNGPTGTSAISIMKRPIKMILRLLNSIGLSIGPDLLSLQPVSFRHIPTDPMDASPPLFTGDWPIEVTSQFSRLGQLFVVSDDPFPLNIDAVIQDIDVTEV